MAMQQGQNKKLVLQAKQQPSLCITFFWFISLTFTKLPTATLHGERHTGKFCDILKEAKQMW